MKKQNENIDQNENDIDNLFYDNDENKYYYLILF